LWDKNLLETGEIKNKNKKEEEVDGNLLKNRKRKTKCIPKSLKPKKRQLYLTTILKDQIVKKLYSVNICLSSRQASLFEYKS
jgi:hypothetical protein